MDCSKFIPSELGSRWKGCKNCNQIEWISLSNWKFNKVLLDVTRICLSLLKDKIPSSSSSDQNFKVDELVSRFNGFRIENLRGYMAMDDIQLLCDGHGSAAAGVKRLCCCRLPNNSLVISLDVAEMNEAIKQCLLRDFWKWLTKPKHRSENPTQVFLHSLKNCCLISYEFLWNGGRGLSQRA